MFLLIFVLGGGAVFGLDAFVCCAEVVFPFSLPCQGQQQRLVAADAGERRRAGVAGPGGDAAARPAGAADQDWVLEPPAGGYGGEHVPNHPQLRVQGAAGQNMV